MTSTRSLLILLAFLLLAPAAVGEEAFPLTKGTYWVYRGPAKWTDNGTTVNKTVTVKMQVLETIKRQHVLFAVVQGHPSDFRSDQRDAPHFLIVRAGAGAYYLLRGERLDVALKRIRNPKDDLLDLVKESELFLDLPLTIGKVFGETGQITRQDGNDTTHRWLWMVFKAVTRTFADVKGITPAKKWTEYKLFYRTNPDEQWISFVPGIGITSYTYRHHPDIEGAQLSLVEFHQGE